MHVPTTQTPLPAHVAGLIAARSMVRPYTASLPLRQRKRQASATAAAALAGWTLVRLEGDSGHEEFVATRGHETIRFGSLMQVEAWIDVLIEQRVTMGRWEVASAPA